MPQDLGHSVRGIFSLVCVTFAPSSSSKSVNDEDCRIMLQEIGGKGDNYNNSVCSGSLQNIFWFLA